MRQKRKYAEWNSHLWLTGLGHCMYSIYYTKKEKKGSLCEKTAQPWTSTEIKSSLIVETGGHGWLDMEIKKYGQNSPPFTSRAHLLSRLPRNTCSHSDPGVMCIYVGFYVIINTKSWKKEDLSSTGLSSSLNKELRVHLWYYCLVQVC